MFFGELAKYFWLNFSLVVIKSYSLCRPAEWFSSHSGGNHFDRNIGRALERRAAAQVDDVCIIINVFSFSLKEQTSFRTEITVPQIHIYTLKAIIQKVILYYISKR